MNHQRDTVILVECWRCGYEQYFDTAQLPGGDKHCQQCGAFLPITVMLRFGDPLTDNILPVGLGLLVALIYIFYGGGLISLLVGPFFAWGAWQLRRWSER